MDKNSELRGFLMGAFWGGVIGVLSGIMLAPKSGEITRQEVGEKLKLLTDQLSDLFAEAGASIEKFSSKISNITAGEDSVKRKIEEIKSELEDIKLATE